MAILSWIDNDFQRHLRETNHIDMIDDCVIYYDSNRDKFMELNKENVAELVILSSNTQLEEIRVFGDKYYELTKERID